MTSAGNRRVGNIEISSPPNSTRKLIIIESLIIAGWFAFYYGAWNLIDMLELNDKIWFNVVMVLVGLFFILLVAVVILKRNNN